MMVAALIGHWASSTEDCPPGKQAPQILLASCEYQSKVQMFDVPGRATALYEFLVIVGRGGQLRCRESVLSVPTLEYRGYELRAYSQQVFPPYCDPYADGIKSCLCVLTQFLREEWFRDGTGH
jgi:hypothetical protein